ncbi:aspartate ammonia-lyase [Methanolobus sp. ZRKC2]|uniref:class II fumarate hydratase n=1 Tax=Methanolobus sp. ZRKC2 TaxID=3125783 RepID=UPI00324D6F90
MTRLEKDTLGEVEVPEDVYYGPQTARAVDNFKVSGERLPPSFIKAQAAIKIASARANMQLGKLDGKTGEAIVRAATEVREGKFDGDFVVDAFQSGAGTSQNMNANEVIANRALEIMGFRKGRYDVIHPNDHVNMSQSSNDTSHTAIHISAMETLKKELLPAVLEMNELLLERSDEFMDIVKPGRTHLQDAVPITLGQEFSGYARMIELGVERLFRAMNDLEELNMGGTAVGTGLNTPIGFGAVAVKEMNRITGIDFRLAENAFEATQGADAILNTSAALRNLAVSLTKIANDLRLLSSGPRASLGEINLPAVQPGSSIMPGKVNPVMGEMMNMACFQIIGNDTAIMMAAQAGQLDLNVFTPSLAYNLLKSIRILSGAIDSFNRKCLGGITANRQRCAELAESSLALATSMAPEIGYEEAAQISYRAFREDKSIREIVDEMEILTDEKKAELLDPMKLTGVRK